VSARAVLVGLPGTGKSTVGRRLAERLGVAFADSDQLVESRAGCSVAEIFAGAGEAAFRAAECDAIATALTAFDGVLALGGGAVLAETTRDALARAPVPVVLLRAQLSTLASRLGSALDRPLLADDPPARLAELAAARDALYHDVATLVVDTEDLSVGEVAAAIEQMLATAAR
jgi:shikimate kinase